MASGSSAAMAVGLMIYLLLASHVDACYLRNCPIGGKRELRLLSRNADNNGGDDALVHWFDRLDFQPHACPSCGRDNSGRCIGPHICCRRNSRCNYDTATCHKENLLPTPCTLPTWPRCGQQKLCVSPTQCCDETGCEFSDECQQLFDSSDRTTS